MRHEKSRISFSTLKVTSATKKLRPGDKVRVVPAHEQISHFLEPKRRLVNENEPFGEQLSHPLWKLGCGMFQEVTQCDSEDPSLLRTSCVVTNWNRGRVRFPVLLSLFSPLFPECVAQKTRLQLLLKITNQVLREQKEAVFWLFTVCRDEIAFNAWFSHSYLKTASWHVMLVITRRPSLSDNERKRR